VAAKYVTAEELQRQLEQLAADLGVSVKELVDALQASIDQNTGRIEANEQSIQQILKRLDAIDVINDQDGVESLAEKIKALDDMLSENGTLATDLQYTSIYTC